MTASQLDATVLSRPEDLVIGLLAVLADRGVETLKTTDKVLHASFGAALGVFHAAGGTFEELAESFYSDVVTNTYDELNNAIIAAQGLNFLRFPNPSYSRLQLTIPPSAVSRILYKKFSAAQRKVFEEAATALQQSMRG